MNKHEFLDKLNQKLADYNFSYKASKEILEDYDEMISEAIENGEIEEKFIEKLGSPKKIAKELASENDEINEKNHKIIALMPFISTILFFILGFMFGLWHIAWIFFLLIPVAGIVFSTRFSKTTIIALSPFICIILFFIAGYYDKWHLAWLIFFLIPASTIITQKKTSYKLLSILGYIITPIVYLYLQSISSSPYILLIFLVSYYVTIIMNEYTGPKALKIAYYIAPLIYIPFNIVFGLWLYSLLAFLILPILSLYFSGEKHGFVAYTPFIAILLFFLIGSFFDAYHVAWMVFLLIPIAGVLSDRK